MPAFTPQAICVVLPQTTIGIAMTLVKSVGANLRALDAD